MACNFHIRGTITNVPELTLSGKKNNYCYVDVCTGTKMSQKYYETEVIRTIGIIKGVPELIMEDFKKGDFVSVSGFMSKAYLNRKEYAMIIKRIKHVKPKKSRKKKF